MGAPPPPTTPHSLHSWIPGAGSPSEGTSGLFWQQEWHQRSVSVLGLKSWVIGVFSQMDQSNMAASSPTELWAAVAEQQLYTEPNLNKTNDDSMARVRLSPICTNVISKPSLRRPNDLSLLFAQLHFRPHWSVTWQLQTTNGEWWAAIKVSYGRHEQLKDSHPFFFVQMWGLVGKLGSAEDNEIDKAETPRRKSGNSASTPSCSHTQSD